MLRNPVRYINTQKRGLDIRTYLSAPRQPEKDLPRLPWAIAIAIMPIFERGLPTNMWFSTLAPSSTPAPG